MLRLPALFWQYCDQKDKKCWQFSLQERSEKDLDIPTRGIEPRAGVWETPMLAITPYRSGLANYAFWFNFDPCDLASCVSCTSVRDSISLTQPTSEVLASFNWLALFSWFQPSHVLWTKHVLQIPLICNCHPPLSHSTNHCTTYDLKADLQYSQLKVTVCQTQKKLSEPRRSSRFEGESAELM